MDQILQEIQRLVGPLWVPMQFAIGVGVCTYALLFALKRRNESKQDEKANRWLPLIGLAFASGSMVVLVAAGWANPCAGECETRTVEIAASAVIGAFGFGISYFVHKLAGLFARPKE